MARKERGLFEVRPGCWGIRYTDPSTGREVRRRIGTKTLALRTLEKIRGEIVMGRYQMPGSTRSPTLRDVLASYLAGYRHRGNGTKPDAFVRRWLAQLDPDTRVATLTPSDIRNALGRMAAEEQLAGATLNRHLACLRRAINLAIEDGKLRDNPARKVRREREVSRERILTREEESRLREVMSMEGFSIVELFLLTGLRRNELWSLTWDDVDLEGGFLTVRAAYAKNGESRTIPLSPRAQQILRQRREFQRVRPAPEITYAAWYRRTFVPACAKAGITGICLHSLRHTAASRLAMAGVGLRGIAEFLGHKSLDMVMRYSHLTDDHLRRGVALLDGGGDKQ